MTCVHCTYDPDSFGGEAPDGRKVKGTLHWVGAASAADCTIRLYDRLFQVENPSDEHDGSFTDNLNPHSLEVLDDCKMDRSLTDAQPGDTSQFMRQGYFCVDPDSSDGHLIFNRTVALKDSWQKGK